MQNFPKSAFGILKKALLSFENEAVPVEEKIPFAVIILSRIPDENLTKFARPLLRFCGDTSSKFVEQSGL